MELANFHQLLPSPLIHVLTTAVVFASVILALCLSGFIAHKLPIPSSYF